MSNCFLQLFLSQYPALWKCLCVLIIQEIFCQLSVIIILLVPDFKCETLESCDYCLWVGWPDLKKKYINFSLWFICWGNTIKKGGGGEGMRGYILCCFLLQVLLGRTVSQRGSSCIYVHNLSFFKYSRNSWKMQMLKSV